MDMHKVFTCQDEEQYHTAMLTYQEKQLPIQVKTRGNFRKDKEICDFPPLSMLIDSLSALETPFATHSRLKLVTHCQQLDDTYEQMVLEEYASYKTYNLFTPKSFKVRLAKITYKDTKDSTYSSEKLAFFLETSKVMAKRIGGKLVKETDTIQQVACNSFLMTQMALFEFMIGNTDWSVSNKHNIALVKMPNEQVLPVPYDFDCAGIVDAPYASPSPELRLKSVRERLYRGYCQSEAEFYWIVDIFKEKHHAIDSLWENLPYYDVQRKQKTRKYLDDFYSLLNNKDSIQWHFLKNCR